MEKYAILFCMILIIISCEDKNMKNKDQFTFGDKWSVLQGENNGQPMIIRRNNWCKKIQGNPSWPIRAGVAFKFQRQSDNGLPIQEETDILNKLEDNLFDVFQENNNSVVVIVITTSGFREYIIYTESEESFNNSFSKLQEMFPVYQLTNYIEDDPKWEGYKSYKE